MIFPNVSGNVQRYCRRTSECALVQTLPFLPSKGERVPLLQLSGGERTSAHSEPTAWRQKDSTGSKDGLCSISICPLWIHSSPACWGFGARGVARASQLKPHHWRCSEVVELSSLQQYITEVSYFNVVIQKIFSSNSHSAFNYAKPSFQLLHTHILLNLINTRIWPRRP